MTATRQLWMLTGGNGVGKSTFYRVFLAPLEVRLINADLVVGKMNPGNTENAAYDAAHITAGVVEDLIRQGVSFAYETVFSHESKIDFTARAKVCGYEIILVYIHLENAGLNEARVHQRVTEGGHNVPADRIRSRIPRTMKNVNTALPLVDEARLFDNSSREDPFKAVAVVKKGALVRVSDPLPEWAREVVRGIP